MLNHIALIDYVLSAERDGQTFRMADALAELLADIAAAARTSATILQQGENGRPPRTAPAR